MHQACTTHSFRANSVTDFEEGEVQALSNPNNLVSVVGKSASSSETALKKKNCVLFQRLCGHKPPQSLNQNNRLPTGQQAFQHKYHSYSSPQPYP